MIRKEMRMRRKLAFCLFFALLLCQVPALAWNRSDDYEDFNAGYAADGGVIVRDIVEGGDTYGYSYDGINWLPIEGGGALLGGGELSRLVPYNGRSFMILGSQFPLCYASEDGIHWRDLTGLDWFASSGAGRGITDLYFKWTGSEYIMCQNLVDAGGMFGFGAAGASPRNSVVCFLDEEFSLTGEYDFGVDVADVGYAYGTYYAKTADDTETAVFSSTNKETWLKTGLTEIPEETPRGIKLFRKGDCVSGGFLFRLEDGNVLASADGVSLGTLCGIPQSRWLDSDPGSATTGIKAYVGRDGAVVLGTYTAGGSIFSNESTAVCTRAELRAALDAAQPRYSIGKTYVSDGTVTVCKESYQGEDGEWGYFCWSYDGMSWNPVRAGDGEGFSGNWLYLLPYNGKSFFALGIYGKFAYTSEDGITWTRLDKDWFEENALFIRPGYGWNRNLYQFKWTDGGYMMCQSIRNDPHGVPAGTAESPGNTRVRFLDGEFNLVGEYDFETRVSAVGFAGGTYYAQTGYDETAVIWSSTDQKTWSQTDLSAVPNEVSEAAGTGGSGGTAASPVYVTLDGDELSFDVRLLTEGDLILLPIRSIAEALGFAVEWDQKQNLAVCSRGEAEIIVSIHGTDAWVNGAHHALEVSARAENGRTYVPVGFLKAAFGLTADWVQETGTVVLKHP